MNGVPVGGDLFPESIPVDVERRRALVEGISDSLVRKGPLVVGQWRRVVGPEGRIVAGHVTGTERRVEGIRLRRSTDCTSAIRRRRVPRAREAEPVLFASGYRLGAVAAVLLVVSAVGRVLLVTRARATTGTARTEAIAPLVVWCVAACRRQRSA